MMKFTPKMTFAGVLLIWVFAAMPYFVPAINSITPLVLGLPFVVFWEFLAIVLLIVLLIVCKNYAWDTFDREDSEGGSDE